MVKEVILTPRAITNYEHIVEYLMYKWGIKVTNNFINRMVEVSVLLAEDPGRFPFENRVKQVQRCVVTKHNVLYFKETNKQIKILTIFDARQDPKKLTDII
jgi:plasmid stabilization system protein ParE